MVKSEIQPPAAIKAVVLHEGPHLAALTHQMLDQMRSDEAVRTRDENALSVEVHRSLWSQSRVIRNVIDAC